MRLFFIESENEFLLALKQVAEPLKVLSGDISGETKTQVIMVVTEQYILDCNIIEFREREPNVSE
jgi:hypothetical protein